VIAVEHLFNESKRAAGNEAESPRSTDLKCLRGLSFSRDQCYSDSMAAPC